MYFICLGCREFYAFANKTIMRRRFIMHQHNKTVSCLFNIIQLFPFCTIFSISKCMRINKMLTRSHVYVCVHRLRVVAASQEFQRERFLPLVLVQWQSRHSLLLSCSVLEHPQISCSHQPCCKTKLSMSNGNFIK